MVIRLKLCFFLEYNYFFIFLGKTKVSSMAWFIHQELKLIFELASAIFTD